MTFQYHPESERSTFSWDDLAVSSSWYPDSCQICRGVNKGTARLKFNRRQPPSLLSPSFPSFLFLPLLSPPLYQLGDLGSAESSPMGPGAKPPPLNDLVHIWAKKNDSGDNTVMDFESKYLQFSRVSEFAEK